MTHTRKLPSNTNHNYMTAKQCRNTCSMWFYSFTKIAKCSIKFR